MQASKIRGGKRVPGFTMIELLIVVTIVGILAAIALPMYFEFITRAKITDGLNKLSSYQGKLIKFHDDNQGTYLNTVTGLCGLTNPVAAPEDYFTITCGPPLATALTYTVVATGIPAKGMGGFIYQVDQAGVKSSFGPAPWQPGVGCWAIRKDGSC